MWSKPGTFGGFSGAEERYIRDRLLRHFLHWYARRATAAFFYNTGSDVSTGTGTSSALTESGYNWFRRTGAGTDGVEAGGKLSTLICTVGMKPRVLFHVRLGSDITNASWWIGLCTASAPTKAATYSQNHVMLRYVHGTDTGWVIHTGDGSNQTADSTVFYAASNSQEIWLEIDLTVSGQATFTLYNSEGGVLATKTVTSASFYLPAASAGLLWHCCNYANGAYVRIMDLSAVEVFFS